MHESLIQALRFCASGERFPRLCTEACPLYCAKGNAKTCTACIDSLLRQAADALEKAEERRHGYWIETNEGTFCSESGKKPIEVGAYHVCYYSGPFCTNCGAKMDAKEED